MWYIPYGEARFGLRWKGHICVSAFFLGSCLLFTEPASTDFSKFVFKTGSYGTIHTLDLCHKGYGTVTLVIFHILWCSLSCNDVDTYGCSKPTLWGWWLIDITKRFSKENNRTRKEEKLNEEQLMELAQIFCLDIIGTLNTN